MEPGTVFGLLVILVAFPAVVFSGLAKLKKARAGSGEALRASELDALVRRSVERATAPLHARLEALEAIATADDGPPPRVLESAPRRLDPALLAEPDDDLAPVATLARQRA